MNESKDKTLNLTHKSSFSKKEVEEKSSSLLKELGFDRVNFEGMDEGARWTVKAVLLQVNLNVMAQLSSSMLDEGLREDLELKKAAIDNIILKIPR